MSGALKLSKLREKAAIIQRRMAENTPRGMRRADLSFLFCEERNECVTAGEQC